MRFGLRIHLIVRETDGEAWDAADRLISRLSDDIVAEAQRRFREDFDSEGQRRMAALHGGRRDRLEVAPNLWAGIGLIRPGAGTALVGDPATVAARLRAYQEAGIDTIIASGFPHLEEAYRVAELLFPALGRSGGRTARNRMLPGEFMRPRPRRDTRVQGLLRGGGRCASGHWAGPCRRLSSSFGRRGRRRGSLRPTCSRRPPPSSPPPGPCSCPASFLQNMGVSFLRAMAGFLVGGGIGLALGLANGLSATSERLLDTSLQMIRNVPHLALIPLVILWFGIGEEAKLFLVALGVFFPIYANTFLGIRTADRQLIEMGRTYGMSPWRLFLRVILPGALPSIFVGLRYGLGIMWLTLIVAETIAASSGLGYMAMQAREFLQVDVIVLAILIYALLGKLADSAVRLLEQRCLDWHPAFQKG